MTGIVREYTVKIVKISKFSLCRYSTKSQMALDVPSRSTNTEQIKLSFLGPKIWSKINLNIKKVKTTSFYLAVKKDFLIHL